MMSRIFALILLLGVIYLLGVFLFPGITDRYGHASWNESLRSLKYDMESYTGSPMSLYDKLKSQTTEIVEESKNTLDNAQKVIETKTTQVKETAESVQKAVDAVEKAKNDLEKLSTFGSGKTNTGITQ